MKRLAIAAAAAFVLLASPAMAGHKGGKQSLNVNLNVATGKGGLVGTLLGTVRGRNGLNVNTNVTTTKRGVLGVLLGGGRGHGHGGW